MTAFALSIGLQEQAYFSNVARAARAFVEALVGASVKPVATRESTIDELERLSARYEKAMPALADELRCMAAHVN